MSKIVLNCEKCGGTLEVTDDMELFKCEYCGMPYLVERKGGAVHITRLEARVERVESEQEKVRLDVIRSKLERVRSDIEQLYDQLSSVESGAGWGHRLFREESAQKLYQEELELRQEYTQRGGNDAAVESYVNVVEVISLLEPVFPKLKLGVGVAKEKKPLLGPIHYCPAVRTKVIGGRLNGGAILYIMRQSSAFKLFLSRRQKRQVSAILLERYPHRLIE